MNEEQKLAAMEAVFGPTLGPVFIHKMSRASAAQHWGSKATAPRQPTAAQIKKQQKEADDEAELEVLQDEMDDMPIKTYKKMKNRLAALEEINKQLIAKLRDR